MKNFQTFSNIFLIFSVFFGVFFAETTFAEIAPSNTSEITSYEKYLESAKSYCDSSNRVW